MCEQIKCNQCNKESPKADTFIFKDKTYCMECLYCLIMELAENGIIMIDFEDCETKGIQVEV